MSLRQLFWSAYGCILLIGTAVWCLVSFTVALAISAILVGILLLAALAACVGWRYLTRPGVFKIPEIHRQH
jgi:hypothetical protein